MSGYGDDLPNTSTAPTEESRLKKSKSSETLPPHPSTLVSAEETKTKHGKKRARDAVDSLSSTSTPGGLTNFSASNEGSSNQGSPAPGAVNAKKAKKAKKMARKSSTTSA